MVYFNCSSAGPGVSGSECQKSCQMLDRDCVRLIHDCCWIFLLVCTKTAVWLSKCFALIGCRKAHNVSQAAFVLTGCCPMVKEAALRRRTVPACIMEYLIIPVKHWPRTATPGESSNPALPMLFHFTVVCVWLINHHATGCNLIRANDSTCRGRTWNCTDQVCDGTCAVYGEGHYATFDGKKFFFRGDCSYVFSEVWHKFMLTHCDLVDVDVVTLTYSFFQDYCGNNLDGSFRVLIEKIPCGATESICSINIKLFLGVHKTTILEYILYI